MVTKGPKITKVIEVLKTTETESSNVLKENTSDNTKSKTVSSSKQASDELNKSKELTDLVFPNGLGLPDDIFSLKGCIPTSVPNLERKAVRWSEDDDVISIPVSNLQDEDDEAENLPRQKPKGRKYTNVAKAEPMFKDEQCKTQ